MQPIIKLEGVSKKYNLGQINTGTLYGDLNKWFSKYQTAKPDMKHFDMKSGIHWALQDINIDIHPGNAVGIIGKNGAGKSTLLKILSRITTPTKGLIKVKGRIASLLEVGTGFHQDLTGRENVYLNGAILGMRKNEITSRIDEIVDFAGINSFFDTPVKRYSSGMYLKLAFSVAAHLDPEVLVVDEVLAVGDFEFQRKCIGKMKEVSDLKGRTILFVSHNMGAIEMLCNKVILLEGGKVSHYGETNLAINKYLDNSKLMSSKNLADRKDRRGNGKIYMTSIKLFDTSDKEIFQVKSGQSFAIHFNYQVAHTVPLPQMLYFGLVISSMGDENLIHHHNRLTMQSLEGYQNCNTVIFSICDFPLLQGDYNISYSVLLDNIYLDAIDNAFHLKVEQGSYGNYKELPSNSHGKILVNADWSLKK